MKPLRAIALAGLSLAATTLLAGMPAQAQQAPTQPNIPVQPEVGGPGAVPPHTDRSVGEYVDDLERRGDRPSEGTR